MKKDEFSTKCNQTDHHRMSGGRQEVSPYPFCSHGAGVRLNGLTSPVCPQRRAVSPRLIPMCASDPSSRKGIPCTCPRAQAFIPCCPSERTSLRETVPSDRLSFAPLARVSMCCWRFLLGCEFAGRPGGYFGASLFSPQMGLGLRFPGLGSAAGRPVSEPHLRASVDLLLLAR